MIILQFIANGIVQGSVYALIAVGFALSYRVTRVFNIAQGATYTLSAYGLFTFARILNLPILISLIIGLGVGVTFVILTEIFIFYPLFKKQAAAGIAIISSLGVYIFLVNTVALLFGNETKILSPGIEKTFTFANVILTRIQILEFLVSFVLIPIFLLLLKRAPIGRKIRGLIDNPMLSIAIGLDIKQIRIITCILGAIFIGIASSLVALDVGIDPQIGIAAILNGAVAMIIGGISSLPGAVFGGLLLGIIQNLVVYQTSARWQNAITFGLLIIFLIFRPEGIFGRKKRAEE